MRKGRIWKQKLRDNLKMEQFENLKIIVRINGLWLAACSVQPFIRGEENIY